MKIIKEMPENAEEGSKWLVMRQNGEVTFSTVSNTYFYEGDASSGADVLDVIHDGEGNLNRVAYYMPLTEETETEAPSVGIDGQIAVSIDMDTFAYILNRLDAVSEILKKLNERDVSAYNQSYAKSASTIVDDIKCGLINVRDAWSNINE